MNSDKMREETASFFSEGEAVVAAVSGGADSMALLDCLMNCGKHLDIVVAHLNHCLRDAESDADADFVENYCKKHNIPCFVRKADIKKLSKERKISSELCGREERYAFFEEFNRRIVTAHTLSDRVETVLLSMTRGTGLSGLCSIPRQRGNIIRPLLSFSRKDIEEYCEKHGICYRQDSSNFVADVSRNRIRLKVLPILKNINTAAEKNIGRTISLIEQDSDFLEKEAKKCYLIANRQDGLQIKSLRKIHPAMLNRVLILFLKDNGISPTSKHIHRLTKLLKSDYHRISLPDKKTACVRKGLLSIEESEEKFSASSVRLFCCNRDECKKFINNADKAFFFFLDCDKIKKDVFICERSPGDSLKLARRPEKTLKKLCNEAALPLPFRKHLRVLKDAEGVIWAEYFGVAQRVMPTENTERFLIIKQEQREL